MNTDWSWKKNGFFGQFICALNCTRLSEKGVGRIRRKERYTPAQPEPESRDMNNNNNIALYKGWWKRSW